MAQIRIIFLYSPGGENEGGNMASYNPGDNETLDEKLSDTKEVNNEKKPLSDKIHDALQDWSNDDQRDQEFDDTRP